MSVRLAFPEPAQLQTLIEELGIAVEIVQGPANIELSFDSARGTMSYASHAPRGFTLGD